MDPNAKKQRRRSVRNLRRSACFVPPSVNYGSAWIGDNQETNIDNLVQTLEELNCQDDTDNHENVQAVGPSHCQHRLVESCGDEACDGFSPGQPIMNKGVVPCSHRKVQQSPGIDFKAVKWSPDVQETRKSSVNSLFSMDTSCQRHSRTCVPAGDDMCLQEGNGEERFLQVLENFKSNAQSREASNDCGEGRLVEQYDDRISKTGSVDDIMVDTHKCSKEVSSNVLCESESKMLDQSNTQNGYGYSNVSKKSLDNSMSPEFTDFCPNSAESSPSIDPMNQAINSFLDVSSSSIFNISFSPMDVRPDTPKTSSCARQFLLGPDTKRTSGDDMLRRSISDIISSFGDPIISADPTTSKEILESDGNMSPCIPTQPTTSIYVSHDFNATTTNALPNDLELDRTYTIDDQTESDCVGRADVHFPNLTETGSEKCPLQPATGTDDSPLHIEDMTMLDFDFVKPKSNRRTSSLFAPVENSRVCYSPSPLPLEKASTVSWEYKSGNVMDCSGKDQSNEGGKEIRTTAEEKCQSIDSKNLQLQVSGIDDGGILSSDIDIETISNNLLHHVNVSQPPSQSHTTLTDCGNVIEPPEQIKTKTKKQRRKSNKLALLLQESERFVVNQSSNANDEQSLVGSQCGHSSDKENEVDVDIIMDVPDLPTSGRSSSHERNVRTRRSRKSWDFRKEPKPEESSFVEPSVVKNSIENETDSGDLDLEELQSLYGKQTYILQSPQPLETIKETSSEKNVFLKKKVKRYLKFGSVTEAKGKKRTKKALSVYNGRQCYFPITAQEFDRKMLDVQICLDSDLDIFV